MSIEDKQTIQTLPVTKAAAARYLKISTLSLDAVASSFRLSTLPGDRCDLVEIWRKCFGIYDVPLANEASMRRPLLSVSDIAKMVGVNDTTLRRAGNTYDSKWNLPNHVDLGPRIRRYLPLHIDYWFRREEPPAWLRRQYGPIGAPGLRLRPTDQTSYVEPIDA